MNHKYFIAIAISCLLFSCTHKKPVIELQLAHLRNIHKLDSATDFTIYNTGDSDLILEDYRSTCECTALNLVKNAVIRPKDSLEVHLSLKRDSASSKKQIVYITIKNNSDSTFKSFPFIF